MRICLVLERFDPQRGGLEHWTWQFARQLIARGHEVHIVAFEFHPESPQLQPGVVTHCIAPMPRSRLERAVAFEKRLRTLEFDVIHDMGSGWYSDIFHPHGGSTVALWEHNLMRIPRWRQIRFWRERRYREMAEIERRQLTTSCACIVAVSRMVQRHFATLHSLPPDRMRLIYNGVDTQRFAPTHRQLYRKRVREEWAVQNDEVLFLMLAHNLLLKNADTVIHAVAQLTRRGQSPRVIIVGGKKPGRFVGIAERLRISKAVTFHEAVDDPGPLFAASDVFVHPTWYDPCSLVTLEAWACGLPVITTNFNGASELMAPGREGYLLENPADSAALAARMNDLMCDGALRQSMGEAGRKLAEEHSFARQTEEFLVLYEEVARKKVSQRSSPGCESE